MLAKPLHKHHPCSPAGEMLLSRARYGLESRQLSEYRHRMSLTISNVTRDDFRAYFCVAKNAVGEAADRVDLHGGYTGQRGKLGP